MLHDAGGRALPNLSESKMQRYCAENLKLLASGLESLSLFPQHFRGNKCLLNRLCMALIILMARNLLLGKWFYRYKVK